jgi:hypothetical protein
MRYLLCTRNLISPVPFTKKALISADFLQLNWHKKTENSSFTLFAFEGASTMLCHSLNIPITFKHKISSVIYHH